MKKIRNWWKKRTKTSSDGNFDGFREFLKHRIDPDNGLLDVIILKGILSAEEVEGVKAKRSREKRNVKLLDYISCNRKHNEFIVALKDAGQSEIADRVAEIQAKEKWTNAITSHYRFIVDRMCPEFGLIDKLYECHVLTNEEKNEIEGHATIQSKNKLILKCLTPENKLKKFIEVLGKSDQTHLVKYLEYDGEYNPALKGEWPITEKEMISIDSNYVNLIDLLDLSELPGRLYSTGVINKAARDLISTRSTPREQSKTLLEILRRCSLSSYWQTIRCLRETNQGHIAEMLETGGVTARVDVNLESEGVNVNEIEQNIVAQINDLLRNATLSESNYIWEQVLQLKLIGARQGHSVSLYFQCNQTHEVDHLEELATEGYLKKLIESLFSHLTEISKKIKLSLKWTSDVFNDCRLALQVYDEEIRISELAPTDINSLPIEILDVILKKSYVAFIQRKSKSDEARNHEIIKRLAEVDFCWMNRLTTERFKKACWVHLSNMYTRKNRAYFIYRSNQEFFEENIDPLIINRKDLKLFDVIGDVDLAIVSNDVRLDAKKRNSMRRTIGLPLVPTFKDKAKLDNFISYLGRARQRSVVKFLKNGGAAIRIDIRGRDSSGIKWSQHLMTRLEELKDKSMTKSSEMETLISDLKNYGIKVMHFAADRDVTVWMWCKQADAQGRLKSLNESKDLSYLLCQLTKQSPDFFNERIENIDKDQLKKKIVVSPPQLVELMTTFNLQEEVRGITKLRNKLYVLCLRKTGVSSSSYPICAVLNVFESKNPHNFLTKIELNEITFPTDIVASETENALFISAYVGQDRPCVVKISPHGDFKQNTILWLNLEPEFRPLSLFISTNGQLVMVSKTPSVTLRVYDPDARLCLSIGLHKDIVDPIHAVESSTGNFIISHKICYGEGNMKFMMAVSILSRDGQKIIRNFRPESKEQRFNCSLFESDFYFCIDSQDRVFVAHPENDRVVLLDSNLRWKQILISTTEETNENNKNTFSLTPWKCFYDEDNKQLAVLRRYRRLFTDVKVYALKL